MISQQDLMVRSLGTCRFAPPLDFRSDNRPDETIYRSEANRIRLNPRLINGELPDPDLTVEEAGPRERIYFNPAKTTAAIVTCGGLSPGLNNVIRSIYSELTEGYGVSRVLGIRHGYLGLNPESGLEPITLDAAYVDMIDKLGGTVLGTSRGPQEPKVMADFLKSRSIDILFCIGGDGTQRGAFAIAKELESQQADISIVGIPKTIDNDVPFVRQSFGYVTALEMASNVIRAAHVEARSVLNGVAIVKLMGRHAGYIAAGATVVSQEVDFTLVPEIDFPLEGDDGLLAAVQHRLAARGHAVIVTAEGAGQHLFESVQTRRDASGNQLNEDIGQLLQDRIKAHFAARDIPVVMKYLDPSYYIRGVPANVHDRLLCNQMGRNAVHAAMAGKTALMIGMEHHQCIHVPIPAVVSQIKRLNVTGDQWRSVLEVTGQPRW